MTGQQNLFLLLKLGLVALFVTGVFVLAGMGKIDSTAAVAAITAGVSSLVVALGISGSGASQAAARVAAAGVPPLGGGGKMASLAPPAVVKSVPPLAVLAIAVFLGTSQSACALPAKDAAAAGVGLELAACMLGVNQTDEAKSPPAQWPQVVLDMGIACGADVADIVTVFGSSSPVGQAAVANASAVHSASVKFHLKSAS